MVEIHHHYIDQAFLIFLLCVEKHGKAWVEVVYMARSGYKTNAGVFFLFHETLDSVSEYYTKCIYLPTASLGVHCTL